MVRLYLLLCWLLAGIAATLAGRFAPPSPPYLGPPRFHGGANNKPVDRVVIHSTVSRCERGGARAIARYFRDTVTRPSSAHYVVDPGEVVQVTYDSVEAYHAPPNLHSLGIEMCDMPGPLPGDGPGTAAWRAARRVWRWRRLEQKLMLRRTARLTAQLCLAYDVPVAFLGPRQLRAGKRGVTTHNNVSRAWGQSDHWDPGFWPRRKFMRMVQAEADKIRKAAS